VPHPLLLVHPGLNCSLYCNAQTSPTMQSDALQFLELEIATSMDIKLYIIWISNHKHVSLYLIIHIA
jgi:hypothetical protein